MHQEENNIQRHSKTPPLPKKETASEKRPDIFVSGRLETYILKSSVYRRRNTRTVGFPKSDPTKGRK